MNDRPIRSNTAKFTCVLETVFACITFSLFAFAVYVAGSLNFAPDAPFKWNLALQVGSRFLLPIATIVAAAILLWLRSRWGLYLTFIANAAGAYVLWLLLSNDLKARLAGPNHLPVVTELGLAIIIAIILAPIVLLFLPAVRREFTGIGVTAATAGNSQQEHT